MESGIIIVRDGTNYRVMYGHLRLAGALSSADEVCVDVKGEGKVKIQKTPKGMFVKRKNAKLPVLAR